MCEVFIYRENEDHCDNTVGNCDILAGRYGCCYMSEEIVNYLSFPVISPQTELQGVLTSLGKQISLNKSILNSTQVVKTRNKKEGNFNETIGKEPHEVCSIHKSATF